MVVIGVSPQGRVGESDGVGEGWNCCGVGCGCGESYLGDEMGRVDRER